VGAKRRCYERQHNQSLAPRWRGCWLNEPGETNNAENLIFISAAAVAAPLAAKPGLRAGWGAGVISLCHVLRRLARARLWGGREERGRQLLIKLK
jgi:hypothetical protein